MNQETDLSYEKVVLKKYFYQFERKCVFSKKHVLLKNSSCNWHQGYTIPTVKTIRKPG